MVIEMWDHPIMDRPDLLSADRIHFAASGQAVLAAEVVRGSRRGAQGAPMTETVAAGTACSHVQPLLVGHRGRPRGCCVERQPVRAAHRAVPGTARACPGRSSMRCTPSTWSGWYPPCSSVGGSPTPSDADGWCSPRWCCVSPEPGALMAGGSELGLALRRPAGDGTRLWPRLRGGHRVAQGAVGAAGDPGAGPQRATVAMTLGFASGAVVAGVCAQWAPHPS